MSAPRQPEDRQLEGGFEEEADLSRLGDGELEVEAKRNRLREARDRRRERRQRAAERKKRSEIDNGVRIALLAFLAVALFGALGTVVVGLARDDADMVRFGLVAACAICGGSLYHLIRAGRG